MGIKRLKSLLLSQKGNMDYSTLGVIAIAVLFLIAIPAAKVAIFETTITEPKKITPEYLALIDQAQTKPNAPLPVGEWVLSDVDGDSHAQYRLYIAQDGTFALSLRGFKKKEKKFDYSVTGVFIVKGSTLEAFDVDGYKGLLPPNNVVIISEYTSDYFSIVDSDSLSEIVFNRVNHLSTGDNKG